MKNDLPPTPVVSFRIDPPRSGEENMRLDEALLEQAEHDPGIRVRLYRWQQPTLSLGHFQSIDDLDKDAAIERSGNREALRSLPWVRRKTGGGAILHDHEWTYCMVLPNRLGGERSEGKGHNDRLYRSVHLAVRDGLQRLGISAALSEQCSCANRMDSDGAVKEPFLCFQRRTPVDLLVGEHKVLGSAQRRNRYGLLQHGSLLLSASARFPSLRGLEDLVDGNIFPVVAMPVDAVLSVTDSESDPSVVSWGAWLVQRLKEGIEAIHPSNC
jgi:lipoyl(octanoyl) transferase